jgi:DNA-binding transcriptional regulator YbjK
MANRREQLLDAAITVLGEAGMHGLTHRTVDAAAGLPAGSCSNHFRTRDALLNAVVERFAAREKAAWDDIAARTSPTNPSELVEAVVAMAREAAGPLRTLTLARYAILLESAIHPPLRQQLLATGSRVRNWFMNWIKTAGSTDPERDAPVLMNHYSGVILHELAVPDPAFDPTDQFTAIITAVIGNRSAEVPT